MTNRRVNALEHVVIPRLENTISYINSECVPLPLPLLLTLTDTRSAEYKKRLDEMDREEFFRLKKIQSKKKRDNAAREAEDTARRLADERAKYGDKGGERDTAGAGEGAGEGEGGGGGQDLLMERDEDGASSLARSLVGPNRCRSAAVAAFACARDPSNTALTSPSRPQSSFEALAPSSPALRCPVLVPPPLLVSPRPRRTLLLLFLLPYVVPRPSRGRAL